MAYGSFWLGNNAPTRPAGRCSPWQRGISASELQAGYFAILEAADICACWLWLLDLRRREELTSPELTAWMNADFFSKLPQRYAQPVRIAFLISPQRALQEQSASSVATIANNTQVGHGYRTALFTDEAAAFHWLAA